MLYYCGAIWVSGRGYFLRGFWEHVFCGVSEVCKSFELSRVGFGDGWVEVGVCGGRGWRGHGPNLLREEVEFLYGVYYFLGRYVDLIICGHWRLSELADYIQSLW